MTQSRIGVGLIKFPHPVKRGKPDNKDVVHMHRKQDRPGLRESFSSMGDYMIDVLCRHGGFHIWLCDDPDKVTCPACLKEMEGKFVFKS